jgi:hypothetical protein
MDRLGELQRNLSMEDMFFFGVNGLKCERNCYEKKSASNHGPLAFRANGLILPPDQFSLARKAKGPWFEADFFSWQFLLHFKPFTRQEISSSIRANPGIQGWFGVSSQWLL